MPAAQAARCWWPMDDIDIDFDRAKIKALVDLPRIFAENHWVPAGEPTNWHTEEGTYEGEECLFLVCDIQVGVIPYEDRREPDFDHVGVGGLRQLVSS